MRIFRQRFCLLLVPLGLPEGDDELEDEPDELPDDDELLEEEELSLFLVAEGDLERERDLRLWL